jgi:hypothetical protein
VGRLTSTGTGTAVITGKESLKFHYHSVAFMKADLNPAETFGLFRTLIRIRIRKTSIQYCTEKEFVEKLLKQTITTTLKGAVTAPVLT